MPRDGGDRVDSGYDVGIVGDAAEDDLGPLTEIELCFSGKAGLLLGLPFGSLGGMFGDFASDNLGVAACRVVDVSLVGISYRCPKSGDVGDGAEWRDERRWPSLFDGSEPQLPSAVDGRVDAQSAPRIGRGAIVEALAHGGSENGAAKGRVAVADHSLVDDAGNVDPLVLNEKPNAVALALRQWADEFCSHLGEPQCVGEFRGDMVIGYNNSVHCACLSNCTTCKRSLSPFTNPQRVRKYASELS